MVTPPTFMIAVRCTMAISRSIRPRERPAISSLIYPSSRIRRMKINAKRTVRSPLGFLLVVIVQHHLRRHEPNSVHRFFDPQNSNWNCEIREPREINQPVRRRINAKEACENSWSLPGREPTGPRTNARSPLGVKPDLRARSGE